MQDIHEKLAEVEAGMQRDRQAALDERRHRDQIAVQDRSATAAEGSVKIAKCSLWLAGLALFLSLTGWSLPVIVEWFKSLGQ